MARKQRPKKRLHKGYLLSDLRLDDNPVTEKDLSKNNKSPMTARPDDRPFRLLDLPSELVLKVLEFSVIHSTKKDPIHINSAVSRDSELSIEDLRHGALSGRPYKKRKWALVQPSITSTCRLLRTEGLKIFYKSNYFFTDSSTDGIYGLSRWLKCLDPTLIPTIYVQWIQHIEHFDLDMELGLGELRWKHFLHEIDWLLEHEELSKLSLDVYFKKDASGVPAMTQGFPKLEWSPTRMSRTKESPCYELGVEVKDGARKDGRDWLFAGDAKIYNMEEQRDANELCWTPEDLGDE